MWQIEVRFKTQLGQKWENLLPLPVKMTIPQVIDKLDEYAKLLSFMGIRVIEFRWNFAGASQGHYYTPNEVITPRYLWQIEPLVEAGPMETAMLLGVAADVDQALALCPPAFVEDWLNTPRRAVCLGSAGAEYANGQILYEAIGPG